MITEHDFQEFCSETGRKWKMYANVSTMLEFAEWYHQQRAQKSATQQEDQYIRTDARSGRAPNCF